VLDPRKAALVLAGFLVGIATLPRPAVGGSLLLAPPPLPAQPARSVSVAGQKYGAPLGARTEAGVEWKLDSHVSIQLNYERTAQAPMMPSDHDDGLLTRLRVKF